LTALVIARLNDRTLPMDRGDLYEDPLDAVLRSQGWGGVTGGGSQLAASGEIEYCEVELSLEAVSAPVLDGIIAELQRRGAPKGSSLRGTALDAERAFGVTEGLAVYLNGTDLPDATYRDSDVNFVFDEFNRLLVGQGKIHSYWQGPTETALYVYGTSFERMRDALQPFLASYPLCERARVVQVA
jgi:hypothetical protein